MARWTVVLNGGTTGDPGYVWGQSGLSHLSVEVLLVCSRVEGCSVSYTVQTDPHTNNLTQLITDARVSNPAIE